MEFSLIDTIAQQTHVARQDVVLGVGDDATLLHVPPGHELAVSVDTLVEGVHFLKHSDPQTLGWKALAVNLSDLAAMGAEPCWALLALTLPGDDATFVSAFSRGFYQLAQQYNVALVGGDTTQGPLAMSITVHGIVPTGKALKRSAAKIGDYIYVTGTLGDAAAALECLQDTSQDACQLRGKMEKPEPQIAAGLVLRDYAHAVIDISDGLLAEVKHICEQSRVGAVIEAAGVPVSKHLERLFSPDKVRQFGLTGGDAYQLCFTVPEDKRKACVEHLSSIGIMASCVGRITDGNDVSVLDENGLPLTMQHKGWEHFRL